VYLKTEEGGYELSEMVFFGTAGVDRKSGKLISWEKKEGKIPDCSNVGELVDLGFRIGMIKKPCVAGDHCVTVVPLKEQKNDGETVFAVAITSGFFASCPRCYVTHEKKSAAENDLCAHCAAAPPLEGEEKKKKKKE
jgi:hypothetical protein